MECSVYTMRNIAARLTLKMGYKEINRVVYTRRDAAGRHKDAPPEMTPAPILSRQLATSPQILLNKSLEVADIALQQLICSFINCISIEIPVTIQLHS